MKKFFLENKGQLFCIITALGLIVGMLSGIKDLFSKNTLELIENKQNNITKIVMGLNADDVDKLLGQCDISTTQTKQQLSCFVDSVINKEVENIPDSLINKYYVFTDYVVRCVFDDGKLIAYFFSIRERGETLPDSLIEIQAVGGILGEDTYSDFGTKTRYPNRFWGNIPASNSELMYYGEVFPPVPRINHYVMLCSVDYGFNYTSVDDKKEAHSYYDLASCLGIGYLAMPFDNYWFEGGDDILNYVLEYNRESGKRWDMDVDTIANFLNERSCNMPNTIGLIQEGYECLVAPLDLNLTIGQIQVINQY